MLMPIISTESQWLAATDLGAMLVHIGGQATERKLRLFACACCRLSPSTELAAEVAERYADGASNLRELAAVRWSAMPVWWAAWDPAWVGGGFAALAAATAAPGPADAKAALFRDVFAFRPARIDSRWLAWNGGTVLKMARTVYDMRRFEDVPILADALEEAGCDAPDILSHCRGPGPHVRGCWVLDLLLGKE
jgi:hypothetical protein